MTISEFKDCFTDKVTHEPFVSRDRHGLPTYGTSTVLTGRLVRKRTHVRANDGSEQVSKGYFWLGSITTSIKEEDRMTFADGLTPPILVVEEYPDESGLHHIKVFFG